MQTDEIIERVVMPDGGEMVLSREGYDVAIEVGGVPLMTSGEHSSEDELGRITGELLRGTTAPRVLIGGLGLGFTLRAALDGLPPDAEVDLVELVPEIVSWNRGPIVGELAGHPVEDPRVRVIVDDVARVIERSVGRYHAIVLDVDNGPDAVTHRGNVGLYRRAGLTQARAALVPDGMLVVWSSFPSETFTAWLAGVGFEVELVPVHSAQVGDPPHYIWLAQRRSSPTQS